MFWAYVDISDSPRVRGAPQVPQVSARKLRRPDSSAESSVIHEDLKPTTPFGELPILEVQGRGFCAVFLWRWREWDLARADRCHPRKPQTLGGLLGPGGLRRPLHPKEEEERERERERESGKLPHP